MLKYLDNTGLAYLWNKIKALVPSLSKKTQSIPFGQVDSTSTSTVFTATIDGIDELRDGVCCYLRNGIVSSEAGFTININNLGAKPVYSTMANASRSESTFSSSYTMLFVYNSSRVEGGCWDMFYGYNSNTNTIGYLIRTNASTLPTATKTYRYRILFSNPSNTKWVAANPSTSTSANDIKTPTTYKINPFGPIVFYGNTTAISAGGSPDPTYLWEQYPFNLGYSFNTTGEALNLTYPAPVYAKCTPQSDGSVKIDSTTPYTQTLPNTEDGSVYIYLGTAYSETNIELVLNHPVYYYKNDKIREWTNAVDLSSEVDGKADKVSGATNGNFASLDSNGNLTDSGHKHSDYLTQHQDISGKADKSEMSVVAGTGNDADKTTITLKTGTSATVLTSHQDISGKVSKVSSSTDNAVVRFDGTSGNIQNSGVTIDDSDQVTAAKFITDSGTNSQVVLGNGDLKDSKELSQYEEYLEWGGRNRSNAYGPLDSALISTLGANRFAFIKASSITVEYSRDGGTTWIDYGLTDLQKTKIFAAPVDSDLYLGKHSTAGSGTANDRLRITVDAHNSNGSVYSEIRKFVCYMATNGAQNCKWTLQLRNVSNFINNIDTWTDVFTNEKLEGWSGINIVQTNITIGASSSNWNNSSSTQNRQFRLIFSQGTPSSNYPSAKIYYVSAYGGVGWYTPSNMAKFGSIYSYDAEQNVTFPGKIIKKNGTSSQFLKADGSVDSNAYISDDSGFVHKSGEETVGGTKTFNGGVTVSGISGLTINETVLKIDQNSCISFEHIYDNQNHAPYINGHYDTTNDEPYILFSGNYGDEKVRLVNIEEPRNNSDAATKYFVQNQGYITTSDLTTPLSSKADKVSGATNGNFASLDSNGNLVDSGHKHSDYLTQHQDISGKIDVPIKFSRDEIPVFTDTGNIQGSGYNPSNFATSAQGAKADTAYQKPSGGIPSTDLSSSVQASLSLADSAIQSHQDISGKADKVSSPTDGNFASLDSNGNLEDSGYSYSSFATSAQGTKADTAIQQSGGELTGDLILKSSTTSGDTPYLVFQRGTDSDSYYDWKIKGTGGNLKFYEAHSGTDTQVLMLSRTTGITASTFNGELDGTISSSTTATTQSSSDNSTKVATTAFVKSAVPNISTSISTDKTSDTKTASPKAVYDEIHPEISSTEPSGGMIPNVVYNFGELSGNTTFTFASPTNNNILNHYYFCFDTPSTAPTITWPSGLTWYGGSDPTISASKHYEISVINNIACYLEV